MKNDDARRLAKSIIMVDPPRLAGDVGSIATDITTLMESGVSIEDIRVNDGQSEWGDNCAASVEQLRELIADWQTSGSADDETTPNDLVRASDWLALFG